MREPAKQRATKRLGVGGRERQGLQRVLGSASPAFAWFRVSLSLSRSSLAFGGRLGGSQVQWFGLVEHVKQIGGINRAVEARGSGSSGEEGEGGGLPAASMGDGGA